MRKFLIAMAAAASILGAGAASYVGAVTVSYLGASSGCNEANQLMNCINASVYGLLNGVGQTKPVSVGQWGTATVPNGNTNITLNTQGGVVTLTGVTVGQNTTVSNNLTNSFITTASACVGTMINDTSGTNSTSYLRAINTAANTLIFSVASGAVNSASSNYVIAFWCAN